ncbi:SpoIIAA family protein [Algicola sagamiensis]|uniref:STAS/SEC14 domain-containing protein n=1 Tax=Algicola sagamiensis TaxID=163869 RepID=UPI0003A86C9E
MISNSQKVRYSPKVTRDSFNKRNGFKEIAMLGQERWQEVVAKVATWFIAEEIKYFEDATEVLT